MCEVSSGKRSRWSIPETGWNQKVGRSKLRVRPGLSVRRWLRNGVSGPPCSLTASPSPARIRPEGRVRGLYGASSRLWPCWWRLWRGYCGVRHGCRCWGGGVRRGRCVRAAVWCIRRREYRSCPIRPKRDIW